MTRNLTDAGPTARPPARLPALAVAPTSADAELRRWLEAVREWLEVRLGARGDYYERAVTFRDLTAAIQELTDRAVLLEAQASVIPGAAELRRQIALTRQELVRFSNSVAASYNGTLTQIVNVSSQTRGVAVEDVAVWAVDMRPTITNGCSSIASIEFGAGQPNFHAMPFAANVDTSCDFHTMLPFGWAGKYFRVYLYWGHGGGGTAHGVVWEVQANTTYDDETVILDFVPGTVVTDTGGTPGNLYIAQSDAVPIASYENEEGSMVSLRVTRRGTNAADTMDITAYLLAVRFTLADIPVTPPACDPYFGSVILLLHGDGANGSTTITDSSIFGRTIAHLGGAAPSISTAQSVFGGASIAPSSGSATMFGPTFTQVAIAEDYTIEFRFRRNIDTNYPFGFSWNSTNSLVKIGGPIDGASRQYRVLLTRNGSFTGVGTTVFALDTWYAVAITRKKVGANITVRVYVNGVKEVEITNTTGALGALSVGEFQLGRNDGSGFLGLGGHLDEFRITRGVVRYPDDTYVLDTTPFPDALCATTDPHWANVSLLIQPTSDDTTIVDRSSFGHSITVTGSTALSTTNPYFSKKSVQGAASSYMSAALGTNGDMGTGDFTIELWFSDAGNNVLFMATSGPYLYNNAFFYNGAASMAAGRTYVGSTGNEPWNHIAITRSAGTLRTFNNGVLQATLSYSTAMDFSTLRFGHFIPNNNLFYQGHYAAIRVTKGVARYTANFAVPTGPFPTSG